MKSFVGLALSAAFIALVAAERAKSAVTPVEKVLELLEGMVANGKKEKHDEGVQYAQYKAFCDDTDQEKTRAIAKAEEDIAVLKAEIAKAAADADELAEEIAEHDKDIARWAEEMTKATEERKIQKEDYDTLHADYSESLSALSRAIEVMKNAKKDGSVPQAVLLAVKNLKIVPEEAKQVMGSFLARDAAQGLEDDDQSPVYAPEANAYDFQSSPVLELMKKLNDKFTAEQTKIEMNEMKAVQAYQMLEQRITRETAEATAMREDKMKTKAKTLQTKSKKELELEKIQYDKAADEKYLKEVKATCAKKAADFESRQTLRTEEISALEQAIKIISEESTLHRDRYTTLLQPHSTAATAFAQLRGDDKTHLTTRLSEYLQSRAKVLNSQVLSLLATKTAGSHFDKVKKMIKDLLDRLEKEAAEEAEHKAWCDEQMATNKATRDDKTAQVEALKADVDELTANIASEAEKARVLTTEVKALDAAMVEATTLRQKESATNKVTIEDSLLAQKAVASAIITLKEFYRNAAKAEVLVQEKQAPLDPNPDDPVGTSGPATKIFNDVAGQEKAYTGMQGENAGVVGMLEVIMSDFTRLESETRSAESQASDEYDAFMNESVANKEEKLRSRRRAELTKLDNEQVLQERNEDLAGTQKELDAALEYFEKLKEPCIDDGIKYSDRDKARLEEIAALKNCWKILNGEDVGASP